MSYQQNYGTTGGQGGGGAFGGHGYGGGGGRGRGGRGGKGGGGYGPPSGDRPDCNFCKANGHRIQNCPDLAEGERNATCRGCGKKGHSERNCPQKDGQPVSGGAGGGPSPGPCPDPGPEPAFQPTSELFDNRSIFDRTKYEMFLNEKKQALAADKSEDAPSRIHELRKEFGKGKHHVLANHFALKLPDKPLFQYEVVGMDDPVFQKKTARAGTDEKAQADQTAATDVTNSTPDPMQSSSNQKANPTRPLARGQKEELFNELVKACPTLSNHRMDYATDGMRYIVSWENLLPSFEASRKKCPAPSGQIDPPDPHMVFRTSLHNRILTVWYRGRVDVEAISRSSSGAQPTFRTTSSNATGIAPDHAINLIIAKAANASPARIFRAGRNKIYFENPARDLTDGIVAYQGFFSTVKIGMGRPILNVSLATTAFYKPMPLADFPRNLRVGRKVKVSYLNKIKTVRGFGKIPSEQEFEIVDEFGQTKSITVLEHLKSKVEIEESFWYRIARSSEPCVNTSTRKGKEEWFPMETLEIVKFQPCGGRLSGDATSAMINLARAEPFESLKRTVRKRLELLGAQSVKDEHSILSKAGIDLSAKLLKVPAREVDSPVVHYASTLKANLNPLKKRWNLDRLKFRNTTNVLKGPIIVLYPNEEVDEHGALNCGRDLSSQLMNTGIRQIAGHNPNGCEAIDLKHGDNEMAFGNVLANFPSNALVVFVNMNKSSNHATRYDLLKRIAEQKYGLHTVCITHETKKSAQYYANVAMKVNLKLGNHNHVVTTNGKLVDVDLADTIILGADVTPTQKDSDPDSRSLAALVGSVDDTLGQFYGSMTSLARNTEVIAGEKMKVMVMQRLHAFYEKDSKKRLPTNVLYYRDGVDQGQYEKIRKIEVEAIRQAYKSFAASKGVNKQPKITAVVVTKRHHTRFYPVDISQNRNENCKPGTCVDSGVTHPNYFDFYLQSHQAIKGTARPCHYFVLENGMGLSETTLQDFTYKLCFTYVRATLPVGYAPPAYYADRLCERARCYFADFLKSKDGTADNKSDKSSVGGKEDDLSDDLTGRWKTRWDHANNPNGPWHPRLNESMFCM